MDITVARWLTLSKMPNVYRIAIQTNLSAPINDLLPANRDTLALWTTFHPSQTTIDRFVVRCRELDAAEIRYSVGVVGLKEHFDAIEKLRQLLRPEIYLWINAFKDQPDYYKPHEVDQLSIVDPYFHWNIEQHPSLGKPCSAGQTSFSIDGNGNIRRCHFIKDIIGNIYSPDFEHSFKPRLCTQPTCGCYIGYIHRPDLRLTDLYSTGLLARIPASWPKLNPTFAAARDFHWSVKQVFLRPEV